MCVWGKKAAEKSSHGVKQKTPKTLPTRKEEESTDLSLNRLISGEGLPLGKKSPFNSIPILGQIFSIFM